MYIKNIEQLLRSGFDIKRSIREGSILYGKPIKYTDENFALKLIDGTILPAIFIFDDDINEDSFSKFEIKDIKNNTLILKMISNNDNSKKETSIDRVLSNLNIPLKEGKEIILSLLKFGLPARNEEILEIYHNLNLLNSLKNTDYNTFISSLKLNDEASLDIIKANKTFNNILNTLKDIDIDFLSFLKENNLDIDINNILKLKNFIDSYEDLNTIIDFAKENIDNNYAKQYDNKNIIPYNIEENDFLFELEDKNTNQNPPIDIESDISKKIICEFKDKKNDSEFVFLNKLNEKISNFKIKNNFSFLSLSKTLELLKENPKLLKNINHSFITNFKSNLEILKQINNNYYILFFNGYNQDELFKNNIIIKKKYKNSNIIDINNIKVFISVDTPNIGRVESFITKNNSTLFVNFKIEKPFKNLFSSKINLLEENIKALGYDFVSISVIELEIKNDLINLSNFFNDYSFRELDVKV